MKGDKVRENAFVANTARAKMMGLVGEIVGGAHGYCIVSIPSVPYNVHVRSFHLEFADGNHGAPNMPANAPDESMAKLLAKGQKAAVRREKRKKEATQKPKIIYGFRVGDTVKEIATGKCASKMGGNTGTIVGRASGYNVVRVENMPENVYMRSFQLLRLNSEGEWVAGESKSKSKRPRKMETHDGTLGNNDEEDSNSESESDSDSDSDSGSDIDSEGEAEGGLHSKARGDWLKELSGVAALRVLGEESASL